MRSLKIASLVFFAFFFVSCADIDDDDNISGIGQSCASSFDCLPGLICDTEKKVCTEDPESGDSEERDDSDSGDSGATPGDDTDTGSDSDNTDTDTGTVTGDCTPGETQKCPYQGAPETEDTGPCKAGTRICKEDGTWDKCTGEVLPEKEIGEELCSDGIDNDCNGTADDGSDFDGDGHGACSDCCESIETCQSPKDAWDADDPEHLCSGGTLSYTCDSGIQASSTDPEDYAKAIGICQKTTEDSDEWGLISAKITAPDGSSTKVHDKSNGLLSKLGNVIKPQAGSLMLGLSSGKVTDPFTNFYEGKQSAAPTDWFNAHSQKFPAAPSCKKSGTTGDVNDAVMLEMKIKVPEAARSFSFNVYFLTEEYPKYICSDYNDFFVVLLDSKHKSNDPALQNPADKNLAMDSLGNPVGINLAPSGLFSQCEPLSAYPVTSTSCTGTEDLQGTGFEGHGGTGWLTTRGNVLGGETITLRLAIWDLKDHAFDSIVLIDNFKWDVTEYKPGTGKY